MAGGGIGMNTDFKDIEISDRQWVNSLLSYSDYRSTEYNFTVLYIWKDTYKTKIARLDDFLLIRSGECETGFAYIFPAGRGGFCAFSHTFATKTLQTVHAFSLVFFVQYCYNNSIKAAEAVQRAKARRQSAA